MILFRDRFDLDDCFRCLLEKSKFHGGDPAIAANWELPPEFFEKYWFLTIDYDLRRTTNKWRTLQGLSKLNFKDQNSVSPEPKMDDGSENQQPALEPSDVNLNDISSLFDFDITKFAQQNNTHLNINTQTTLNPLYNQQELESPSRAMTSEINMNTIEPVLLTDGTKVPGASRPTMKTAGSIKPRRHHPYLNNNRSTSNTHEPQEPWDFVNSQKDCGTV